MESGFRIKTTLPAEPKTIYEAWLSGPEHSAMTGGAATASAEVGGRFTAWDGYIEGRNLELKPHWCIVQAWRTSQFAPGDPDSRLELCIHARGNGSEVLLIHTNIPPGQVDGYRGGWVDHYFEPMKRYFAGKKPARKSAARKTRAKESKTRKSKTKKTRKPASKKKPSAKKSRRRRARR